MSDDNVKNLTNSFNPTGLRKTLGRVSLVPFLFFFFALVPPLYAQGGVCPVTSGPLADDQWLIQGRCLLRTVKMNRQLGPALTEVPAPLDGLIGRAVAVDKNTLKRYLTERHIDDSRTLVQLICR